MTTAEWWELGCCSLLFSARLSNHSRVQQSLLEYFSTDVWICVYCWINKKNRHLYKFVGLTWFKAFIAVWWLTFPYDKTGIGIPRHEEDNSKFKHKKLRKIQIHQYGQQKVVIRVFKNAEFRSGVYFVLTLLLRRFLATFQSKHMTAFAGFP